MEVRYDIYVLAFAIVVSTLFLSYSVISSAGQISKALSVTGFAVAPGQQQVKLEAPTVLPPSAGQAGPVNPPKAKGKVSFSDVSIKGKDSAKFVLVEYSDFQCPFCKKFFDETEGQILKDYVDAGKLRFVYKNFPLDQIHPLARPAARAAECARDQGKFWEMQNKLFEKSPALEISSLKQYASDLKLDAAKFNACLDNGQAKDVIIDAQEQEGVQNGITGTPGFLITDAGGNVLQTISGAQPYANFQQAFNSLGV